MKVISNNPDVISARLKVNSAFSNYEKEPTIEKEKLLQDEKANFKNVYDQAYEEELESMISKVEKADARAQQAESWKLINQISGRKASKKGIIKGHSSKERVDSWHKHFSELLGKEPNIPDMNDSEEIQTIFNETDLTSKLVHSPWMNVRRLSQLYKPANKLGKMDFIPRC